MDLYYTDEKNVQMLIALMKAHGIKKVIASPGNTNVTFVGSIQHDSYFEIYSAVDERSAAYMACGMAAESKEPVAISCTGATASRNYVPALTEAFYRKLPILAITSTQHTGRIGQLVPQVIDRSVIQNDIAVKSVQIPLIHSADDEWACNDQLNSALLALRRHGGGPVHINLTTNYSRDFSIRDLPQYRVINRFDVEMELPEIKTSHVGIFCGAHGMWSRELTETVDKFCEIYNGVVFCDHTSNYHGKYRIDFCLINGQSDYNNKVRNVDLLIDMGEMSGAYMWINAKEVWRVNPDGEVRDTWKKLSSVFEMSELHFFKNYCMINRSKGLVDVSLYDECVQLDLDIREKVPELPFSNLWMAHELSDKLPKNSILHLGILNSLRSWNFNKIDSSIECYCNTGGFGIDGILSTLVGSALVNKDKLHYCVIGDLAFFYDLNAIANRHVLPNIRILLINNGCGVEFKNYNHFAALFGEDANEFIAAKGHYGQKSSELVKHYACDLGFEYMTAKNKEEFLKNYGRFVENAITDRPMLFEVFTSDRDESEALNLMNHIVEDKPTVRSITKKVMVSAMGEKKTEKIKKLIKGK